MSSNNKLGLAKAQDGMVAITTTLIIMILITLIVSSFSLIVRREQRQSLDRQLSTQAFYAAESGVQDVIAGLRNGTISDNIDNCVDPLLGNRDLGNNSSYSCALVDITPPNQLFSDIDPVDGAVVIPIFGANTNTLRLSWQNSEGSATTFDAPPSTPGVVSFPQGSASLNTAMLRVTVLPDVNSRSALVNGAQTMFLYPNSSSAPDDAGTVQYSPGSQSRPEQGAIINGQCNAGATDPLQPFFCNVNITNLDSRANYYVVVKSLYKAAKLNVSGESTTNRFSRGQAVIDVTGKAADVLRRVEVRVPISRAAELRSRTTGIPEAALESTQGLCKLLEVGSSGVRNDCL